MEAAMAAAGLEVGALAVEVTVVVALAETAMAGWREVAVAAVARLSEPMGGAAAAGATAMAHTVEVSVVAVGSAAVGLVVAATVVVGMGAAGMAMAAEVMVGSGEAVVLVAASKAAVALVEATTGLEGTSAVAIREEAAAQRLTAQDPGVCPGGFP